MNSTSDITFTLQFFSNTECDSSGHGEGETFLGSTTVTTNGSGNASFTHSLTVTVPVGHFVTSIATDPGNNTSEFSQCARVVETTPPEIMVPGSISVEGDMIGGVDQSNAAVHAFLIAAQATDNADPNPTISNNAPDLFRVGDTLVTFTATDSSGNQAVGSATVTVGDTEPPVLTVPDGVTVEGSVTGGVGRASGAIQAFLDAAGATDTVDSSPSVDNDVPDLLPLGQTLVTFSATDASGNRIMAQTTVTMADTTPPVLTVPGGITLGADVSRGVDKTNAAIGGFLAAAVATDVVDLDPVITNDAPELFTVGDTLVTFTATDANGNQATGQATVGVMAPPKPTPTPTTEPIVTPTVPPTQSSVPLPSPTLEPTPTVTPTGGGGCSAPVGGAATLDVGWVLLGLIVPGLALVRVRKRLPWR